MSIKVNMYVTLTFDLLTNDRRENRSSSDYLSEDFLIISTNN